jgi:hypothetical protein
MNISAITLNRKYGPHASSVLIDHNIITGYVVQHYIVSDKLPSVEEFNVWLREKYLTTVGDAFSIHFLKEYHSLLRFLTQWRSTMPETVLKSWKGKSVSLAIYKLESVKWPKVPDSLKFVPICIIPKKPFPYPVKAKEYFEDLSTRIGYVINMTPISSKKEETFVMKARAVSNKIGKIKL